MEIHVDKISTTKQNSFWYYGAGLIVSDITAECFDLKVYVSGELEVYLPPEKNSDETQLYKGINAVQHATYLEYTDKDIELLLSEDQFRLTNWFEIEYTNGDISCWLDTVCSEYDEALEVISNYV